MSDGIDTGQRGATMHLGLKGLMNTLYLEDLGDKTHRGLTGRLAHGLSAGGRVFGYRTNRMAGGSDVATAGRRQSSARFEIQPDEAEIVRRIFREYTSGRSMKAIVHALNAEAVAFPGKDTKRGPARRGWAVSTLQVMLRNEKYIGRWIWNKTRFLKDPESGRRRPVARPPHEWISQDRPELRIIGQDLWAAVRARLSELETRYGLVKGRPPRGGVQVAYSKYLLSGLLRCAQCGARLVAQTARRRRHGRIYHYAWYRCAFAKDKGPAVCSHGTWYGQDRLEGVLVSRFREATQTRLVDWLTAAVNDRIRSAFAEHHARAASVKAEILDLERQAGNLSRAIRDGLDSSTVRADILATEEASVRCASSWRRSRGMGRRRLSSTRQW